MNLSALNESSEGGGVSSLAFFSIAIFASLSLGFHFLSEDGWFPILDSANLALHEAGHPLLSILSERATVYGGTLFQLAFPVAVVWHFYHAGNLSGVGVALIWLAENMFNIARYMADARTQVLPLVGNGEHDWTEIFSRWSILHLDGLIANGMRFIGLMLMIVTVIFLFRQWHSGRDNQTI